MTMTLSDTARILEAVGVGLPLGPPPINNACLPTIYNKLDADAKERVRVINGLLDHRLRVQTKILDKYVHDSKRVYAREKAVVQRDLHRTLQKLPYMEDMPYLEFKHEAKTKDFRKLKAEKLQGYITEPRPIKGVLTERENKPFCDRYFAHHIPVRSRHFKKILPPIRSLDGLDRHDQPLSRSEKLLLTKRMSISDNCLSSRGRLQRSLLLSKVPLPVEDDAATIWSLVSYSNIVATERISSFIVLVYFDEFCWVNISIV